eukprot:IDg21570t1
MFRLLSRASGTSAGTNNDAKAAAPTTALEVYVARRPTTTIEKETFNTRRVSLPEPDKIPDGKVLVRVLWVSADPAMRGWLSPTKNSYVPPVQIGAAMRANGIGRALTGAKGVPIGSLVTGMLGWRSACIIPASLLSVAPELPRNVPMPALLGALGGTGLTAYFGMFRIGKVCAGDNVLVSAAAGATGGVALQIALRVIGARRVVGVAGGAVKCAYVRNVLGAHECVDYKAHDLNARLKEAMPDGIDVYFDNVGGVVLEAALRLLKRGGRVVLCGGISVYNDGVMRGPRNYLALIAKRAIMQGFIVTDYEKEFTNALTELVRWVRDGKITVRLDEVNGLARA